MFYSIQYKNGCLAASEIFTQLIKFYIRSHRKSQIFEKCDSSIDSKNE